MWVIRLLFACLCTMLGACAAEQASVVIIRDPYVVFFGFDEATISPHAADTIREAADAGKASGRPYRIELEGHTDRAGDNAYNMALSLRRATAVKDALIKEGIPAENIGIAGKGEMVPLVQTADGAREPQIAA